MSKSVADVLNEAADIVARGWCQGDYFKGDKCCLVGALALAFFGPEAKTPFTTALWTTERSEAASLLANVVGDLDLTIWNDDFGRTKAEVVTALRAAAQQARS